MSLGDTQILRAGMDNTGPAPGKIQENKSRRLVCDTLGPSLSNWANQVSATRQRDAIHPVSMRCFVISKCLNWRQSSTLQSIETVRFAAEARREAKIADGQGIAGQRNAIFGNISDTVIVMDEAFAGEVSVQSILQHVLELQRLDTQEQIAKNSQTTTLFVPYRGGTDGDDIGEQILRGNLASAKTIELNRSVDEDLEDGEKRKAS